MRWGIGVMTGVLLAVLGLQATVFVIHESERGIKARLGQLEETNQVIRLLEPGLHFKLPFVDEIQIFDARALLLPIAADRIPTLEKKDVTVELYVKYRIQDFGLFYKRTLARFHTARFDRAESLLKQSTTNVLRATFGGKTISALINDGRHEVMQTLKEGVAKSASQYGLEVIDVRIKRLDLPVALSEAVHTRMRTERKREATEILAQGEATASRIRAEADRERVVILATAQKQADETLGEAQAKAAEIYAASFGGAADFYAFYRSLEAYKKTFDERQDILVLSAKSDYFKYLKTQKLMKHE